MASSHPFDLLVELPTSEIRLDCAALHLARDAYPELSLAAPLAQLDRLAEQVAQKRPGLSAPLRYLAMRKTLVEEFELRGNPDYYDADNSYLQRVLERKLGIPISLSVIWLEVARRLKWPASGIGFPGHFLVRFDDPEHFVLIDPFRDGQSLDLADCEQMIKHQFGDDAKLEAGHLAPADTRGILIRMLANLRGVYVSQADWSRLACVLERLVAIEPGRSRHVADLAALRARAGDLHGACARVAAFLHLNPDAEDIEEMRLRLRRLQAEIAAGN